MMVTDVAISLSRKKEDKVNGTGRFHIMKNRYGMDGLTFSAKVNTSTGHFEVSSQIDDDDTPTPPQSSSPKIENFSPIDKSIIQQRFFELSN
jgi:hypothetical protein